MNDLAALLTSFDVSVLFAVSQKIAEAVAAFLSPVLLIIAIYVRLMETQIDGLTGSGKYGTALRDMILWTFVLGSYFAIGNLIFSFFNPIYAWLDSWGSLASTMKAFSDLMAQNKIQLDASGLSMTTIISAPYSLVAMFLYYASLVIVAFITAFLKIANVMTFGFAFVWGLIAIPVSISMTFKILKGWAYLLGFALLWPIAQGFLMGMFSMLFTNSASTLMAITETDPTLRAANIMMLFSVMHLLLAAVMVAAPFIANAVVTNSSAASGIVMPFVAAATAAGVATIKGSQARGTMPGSAGVGSSGAGVSKIAGSNSNYRTPTMRGASSSFARNNSSGGSTAPAPSPTSSSFVSKLDGGASGGADANVFRKDFSAQSPVNFGSTNKGAPADAGADTGAKTKQQQRRGTIIRQNMKKR